VKQFSFLSEDFSIIRNNEYRHILWLCNSHLRWMLEDVQTDDSDKGRYV
jgi:hypothetical protein